MTLLVPLLLCFTFLLLLYAAANFSALETALFALREKAGLSFDSKMKHQNPALVAWLKAPQAGLHEVLLLGSLSNLLLAATGVYLVLDPLYRAGCPPLISALVIFGAGLIAVEFVPKACALRSPESIVRFSLPFFLGVRRFFVPLAFPLRALSEKIVALFAPKRPKTSDTMSADEVETLVTMREEAQAISSDESIILRSTINLNSLAAKEAMTPRVDLPLMPHDASDDEAVNMLESTRNRFVAIFDEKMDAIAYLVDVEQWKLAGRPHWSTLTISPIFVPKTQLAVEIMLEHLQQDDTAAVVVDEYGGFEGLLTRSNIFERVLGKAAPSVSVMATFQSIGPNRYLVAGSARLDEVERELDLTLEAEGVDTIGGLVMNHFGYPPKPGEIMHLDGLDIKVKRTSRARVQQLEVRIFTKEGIES